MAAQFTGSSHTHILLGLKQLFLALLVHLVLELAQARDDLARLVTEEPRDVAELDSIILAVFGCIHKHTRV